MPMRGDNTTYLKDLIISINIPKGICSNITLKIVFLSKRVQEHVAI